MEILKTKYVVYPSRSDHFNIIALGDIHIGNIGCDLAKLKETLDYIQHTKNTFWIGMGDYMESIQIDDPRFDEKSIDPDYKIKDISKLITQQMLDVVSFFRPIKHLCLALLSGNHEETTRIRYHRDIVYEIGERLELTDKLMGYDGFLRLSFERNSRKKLRQQRGTCTSYIIYAAHGFGVARKSGAKVNRLEDVASYIDADLIILAHEHKKIIAPPIIRLGITQNNEICQHKQLAIMSGSFLRGYVNKGQTYIEKKGYPPTDLGVVKIMLKPDTKDLHASL